MQDVGHKHKNLILHYTCFLVLLL